MQTQRNQVIDVMRGVLIFLIVLGHTNFPYNNLIYCFHLPAWFVLSGLLHRERAPRALVAARLTGLIVPFFAANLLTWVLIFLLNPGGLNAMFLNPAAKHTAAQLVPLFTQLAPTNGMMGATWFLPVLFGVSLLGSALIALCRRAELSRGVLAVLSLGLLLWGVEMGRVRYYGDLILVSQFLYVCGYLAATSDVRLNLSKQMILAMFALAALLFQATVYNQFFNMIGRRYNNIWLLILFSLSGTWLVYLLSRWLLASVPLLNRALTAIGEKSIYIVIFHFFGFKVFELMLVFGFGFDKSVLHYFPAPPRTVFPNLLVSTLFSILFCMGIAVAVEWARPHVLRLFAGRRITIKDWMNELLFEKTAA